MQVLDNYDSTSWLMLDVHFKDAEDEFLISIAFVVDRLGCWIPKSIDSVSSSSAGD